jgi:Holliday junction resolvasome RuvABC endonuclease subunit
MGIFPSSRGFGFSLLEGPLSPVAWGIVRIRSARRNRHCIARIARLFGRYSPDVVVLQDMDDPRARRARRIRDLNEAIQVLAETQGIPVVTYSRSRVRHCFGADGFRTRYQMAEAIGRHIPMLERFVPPIRKYWETEHRRMPLFEAVGLVLTYYHSHMPSNEQ